MTYFWFYVAVFFSIGAVMALRVVWVAWCGDDGAVREASVPAAGHPSSERVGAHAAPADDVSGGAVARSSAFGPGDSFRAAGGDSPSGEAGLWS